TALGVMRDAGYANPTRLEAWQFPRYLRDQSEFTLVRDDGEIAEIQWAIVPRYYTLSLTSDTLIDRSVETELGGRPVRTLCPEDLLLVLCVHAGKHLWVRLGWVLDGSETLRRYSDVDVALVHERARSVGALRMLGIGLALAQRLFGTPV